uniref:Uncharacterized protein n=1 Tax=Anguilla anguilla TaxID=7936 RepID=A0A0E9X250_ANGAN
MITISTETIPGCESHKGDYPSFPAVAFRNQPGLLTCLRLPVKVINLLPQPAGPFLLLYSHAFPNIKKCIWLTNPCYQGLRYVHLSKLIRLIKLNPPGIQVFPK